MDKYIIENNLGLDTLAERITVRRKGTDGILLLSKMEMMDMASTAVAYQEYQPLLKLSPENLASYLDIFTSIDHSISASFINLISEYFPMGHLDRYLSKLRSDRHALHPQLVDKWFAQILEGLLYLWNAQLIHRNLKPDSIYLRGNERETECSLVIGDMIPSSVAFDLRMRTRLPRRALSYTAPEVFRTDEYSVASDIYSFGCVLLDMITCDQLTDEETLQLRLCARHDSETLSDTLNHLKTVHEMAPELIRRMMMIEPEKRLTIKDFREDDYVIEAMHAINSNQMKYPSARDKKFKGNDLNEHQKLDYYLNYLKVNKNTESRVEYALQLCNASRAIDQSNLAFMFEKSILPIVEAYSFNAKVLRSTLELLGKVLNDDLINTPRIVTFLAKILIPCSHQEYLIGKLLEILISLSNRNVHLLIKTRPIADLVQIMSKFEGNAHISGECCSLLWLIGKESITTDLRKYQMEIFRFFFHIFQKHPNNSDLYTKICFAFLPLISQKSTLDFLVQFNLVRYLTIGLGEHEENRHAIKAGLAVLSELFPLDERCVMRFLCSRALDGSLIDAMEILHRIFTRFNHEQDIARAISTLLHRMSSYNDAVDEMISTKIESTLLYQIKRFHSDAQDIVQMCEQVSKRIRQRTPVMV